VGFTKTGGVGQKGGEYKKDRKKEEVFYHLSKEPISERRGDKMVSSQHHAT